MAKNRGNLVALIALASLSGKFLLPYDKDHEFEIDENQAEELVNLGYAKYKTVKAESKAPAGNSKTTAKTAENITSDKTSVADSENKSKEATVTNDPEKENKVTDAKDAKDAKEETATDKSAATSEKS